MGYQDNDRSEVFSQHDQTQSKLGDIFNNKFHSFLTLTSQRQSQNITNTF